MSLLIETQVYAARIKDKECLKRSSSGGVFTALSDVYLGRRDAVACCVYNSEKDSVEFQLIETIEERDIARGSKYIQSDLGAIYKECIQWLKRHVDKRLLFVGMGCQASGFVKYAEVTGMRDRVVVVDIICHGAPSPMIWKEYIKTLKDQFCGLVNHITFKDKRNGWNNPTAVVQIAGKEVSIREYVQIFYNCCALRPSCHKCPYTTTERYTDMTIGDYWHIEEKLPDFYDPMGNSLVLLHTVCGIQLFDEIKEKIDFCESNTAECWQLNLERPTEVSTERYRFWDEYYNHGIKYIVKKYGCLKRENYIKKLIRKVKHTISRKV